MSETVAAVCDVPADHAANLAGNDGGVDDASLMRRYAGGDVAAFELLYSRYQKMLYRYLLRQSRHRATAEDLFQEVWDKVIRSADRYQARASFATYLFHIARNCVVDCVRRNRRAQLKEAPSREDHELELVDPAALPDVQTAHAQLEQALRRALDELPEEQREVFVLYEETGMSLEEIALITGTGAETSKSRLRYAVAKLRAALGGLRDELGAGA
jgi:RNA polymerase sigma-70 factor (ECF subfamily)